MVAKGFLLLLISMQKRHIFYPDHQHNHVNIIVLLMMMIPEGGLGCCRDWFRFAPSHYIYNISFKFLLFIFDIIGYIVIEGVNYCTEELKN